MKLYYAPGACSLSPHIVALEAGISLDLVKVNLKEHKTEDGEDYRAINPKGSVPALRLDDGYLLTEGPAVVQYLADRKPEKKLAPANGTLDRYKLMEWLTFINSEVHKPFGVLFNSKNEEAKSEAKTNIKKRFDYVNRQLEGKQFLMGQTFTVADAYMFVMLTWAQGMKFDTPSNLASYFDRLSERPAIRQALSEEGLQKAA